jgi:NADH-quinone oxidoreductase subunit F
MAVEGRTHTPVVDHDRCGFCAACMEACPAELMPEMRREVDTMRGKIYAGQDMQVHLHTEVPPPLPPCQSACPLSQDVRGYIRLAARKEFQKALDLIRSTNPLPSICGYICHHPCESACVRGNLDDALAIRSLKRVVADLASHAIRPQPARLIKHKRIAIIGSGPAGLAAGHDLAQMGYAVEIIESHHKPGGLLAWAIPDFRLPRKILQRDIDFIQESGVKIRTRLTFGRDITLTDLEKTGIDAVIIATGTQKGLTLQLENEESVDGYWECLNFLKQYSDGRKIDLGKQVIVVGGGNAAMDAARSARKLGSANVSVIYRRGPLELPADKEEVSAALAEGIEIQYFTMPKKFVTTHHRITGLECMKTQLKDTAPQGRPNPIQINDSEFILPADTIISAVGQTADHDTVNKGLGLTGVTLETKTDRPDTNLSKVFAAGDFIQGSSTVVEAIANGKKTAEIVDRYLSGLE